MILRETVGVATDEIEIRYGHDVPPVLTQLTLKVQRGEFVGVVGPNGAGKSTLVRALARTLRPTHGTVLLAGQDLYARFSARESAQQIGIVPQDTQVAFEFSVREVVEMGRAPRLPRRPFAALTATDARIVQEALRRAGVEHLADRLVTTLSGGERQRTVLARALAQEPDVLLLDEPTAHLDLHHQTQALSLVRALAHTHGRAVLAVLHDLNLASAYCDRLILLHEGTIAAQGSPAEVLTPTVLSRVYGANVWVRRHPGTGRPFLLPMMDEAPQPRGDLPTVHILCGGGTGAPLLFALAQASFPTTAGGLNMGDADAEAADLLGIDYPRESPFSSLSPATVIETMRLARLADLVLLSATAIGPANVKLLEIALLARQAGKPVICVQASGTPFETRDFTDGSATALWTQIRAAGATVVEDTDAAMAAIFALIE